MSDTTENTEMVECDDGEMRPIADCVECADGEWRPASDCVECEDGEYRKRDECRQTSNGRWYPSDEVIQLAGGDYAHEDDENVVYRADGEYDWVDDCTCVDGEWYSDDEVTHCDSCNRAVLDDDTHCGPEGGRICGRCFEDTSACDGCGEVFWSDDINYDDNDEAYYCESCQSTRSPRLILSYSDKSANRLRSESNDALKFGIELEVESKTDAEDGAKWVRDFLPDTYCVFKHDGSLGDGGFEIVTRPDSMAVHMEKWRPLLDGNPGKRLRSWIGGRCGMHVHVTKSALSQLQLAKMLCFLNAPENTAFVSYVAGRLPCSWCRVSPKKHSDVLHCDERYVALNITSRTAEFRIFRGTLLASSFRKNLEFVQALVAYCSPAQRSIADALSVPKFCEWLDHKAYPNLHAFLVRRGYCQPPRSKAG